VYLLFKHGTEKGERRGRDRIVVGFTTTCAISATKVVSSNPTLGEVYSIQHYVIMFIRYLWQVFGFLRVLRFSFTNKTDRQNIVGMLMKVALNTITLTLKQGYFATNVTTFL